MVQRTALVTGEPGVIGTAICKELANEYSVIVCYFKVGNHDEARHWQNAQHEAGFNFDVLYADTTKFTDCEHLISQILERYERIDVLINNTGITVNTISPGYIETPMIRAMREDVSNSIIAAIPVGRLGKPDEIADAIAFLDSSAISFIAGANIDINSGQYM